MSKEINRSDFLKTLSVSITAVLLNSCKRILTPTPTPTVKPAAISKPTSTTKASPTPTHTPQLPDYCSRVDSKLAEIYLFGKNATRVTELEPGVYQIVIDKNINASAFQAEMEFICLSMLNPDLTYQILWLDEDENILVKYDAFYNQFDQQLSADIQGLRDGDSGFLIPTVNLTKEQVDNCLAHPDFNHRVINWEGGFYLLLDKGVWFERVLVKSRQGGGSGGGGESEGDDNNGGSSSATNDINNISEQ